MPSFGKSSRARLDTCDPRLQEIMDEAIKQIDFSVLCGYRSETEQNQAFASGNSKLKYPQSKHNSMPSKAVDIAPWPIDWNDLGRFRKLAETVKSIAAERGIDIEWGGDWTSFQDMPHFELVEATSQDLLPSEPTDEDITVSLEEIEKQLLN